jgi:hypothetical protein
MAHRRTFPGHSESVDLTYLRIQSLLLEVPDHAQYIASKIEKERESIKHLPPNTGERLNYDSKRNAHFGTLAHLPSPSSIRILGEYLHDDRDVALIPPLKDGMTCISGGSSGNSYHSADALVDLGIRQPPQKKIGIVNVPDVATWRAWYEEVKEGRRAFSFLGQKVEYRFKSDGTWETTPLTISDEALREELKQTTTAPFAATLPVEESFISDHATYSRWPWIAAGAAILITMGAWFFLKSKPS